jgi:hypothetical protein
MKEQVSRYAAHFELFEKQIQSSWAAGIEQFNFIIRCCNHEKGSLSKQIINQIIDCLQCLVKDETGQSIYAKKIDCFKKALKILVAKAPKTHQEDYIKKVVISLEEYGSLIQKTSETDIEKMRDIYLLAHEHMFYINDDRLEAQLVRTIAQLYQKQNNLRLAMFYHAYGYYLLTKKPLLPTEPELIIQAQYALVWPQHYFLYQLFVESDFLFRQITINQKNEDDRNDVYEKLHQLANVFLGKKDKVRAENCYRKLLDILEHYPETENKYAAICIKMIGLLAIKKPVEACVKDDSCASIHKRIKELEDLRQASHSLMNDWPIQQVQSQWSEELVKFIEKIGLEVENSLGPPPCQQFSLLRLGSLARDEACFFSDLELAIIWKNQKNLATEEDITIYFKAFIELVELKILSLGETNELNGLFLTAGLDRIKTRMPRGLRLDEGGHYPFSSKYQQLSGGKCSLIGKPDTLADLFSADFQDDTDLESYRRQLPSRSNGDEVTFFALLDAVVLYKDKALAQEFIQNCHNFLNKKCGNSDFSYQQVLGYSLIDDPFFKGCSLDLSSKENVLIKTQLLHLPQRIVASLTLFYGIQERNSLKRIESLVSQRIIPLPLAQILRYTIELAFSWRMQAQWHYQQEQEDLSLHKENNYFFLSLWHEQDCLRYLAEEVYPFLCRTFIEWRTKVNLSLQNKTQLFEDCTKSASEVLVHLAEYCIYQKKYQQGDSFYQQALMQPNILGSHLEGYQQHYQELNKKIKIKPTEGTSSHLRMVVFK